MPPEKLGAYLRELFRLIDAYGYSTPMYGHFGQGCVHLRITFDFASERGVANFRQFLEDAAEIVLKYGGSFSGEHGDGQARGFLLPKMFGPELMEAFREFKALLDPTNAMNPGKMIDPIQVYDATDNLRIGPSYSPAKSSTWVTYPGDNGLFSEATTRCVGVGACRKVDHGAMCPSYMATREEKYSTRGRAHLLFEMLQGNTIHNGWQSEEVREALDQCLSCEACKTECPVNVDMATWKSEFLAHHYEHRAHPLHHYAFGFMDRWASMAAIAPRLANLPGSIWFTSSLIHRLLHIAPDREIPRFASRNFRSEWNRQHGWKPANNDATVLLWPDTWNNYFQPAALHAAHRVLEQTGARVSIPQRHVCCGRPLYDFGFLDAAKRYLSDILDTFAPEIAAGVPVVMLEPSCASVFRDELVNFFPNECARATPRKTDHNAEPVRRGTPWKLAGSRPDWPPPHRPGPLPPEVADDNASRC